MTDPGGFSAVLANTGSSAGKDKAGASEGVFKSLVARKGGAR